MQRDDDQDEARQIAELAHAASLAGIHGVQVVLPTDKAVVLEGMRFHYLDWGSPQQPPIVFLHGGAMTAHTFDLVCLQLSDRYRCLSLDQRGHGDTDWSDDYSPATFARDIEHFADALGLSRFALVGMSMGGLNALRYAGTWSDRLAGLVVIDIGPEIRPEGAARLRTLMDGMTELTSIEEYVRAAVAANPRRDPIVLRRSLGFSLRRTPAGTWTWKSDPRRRGSAKSAERDRERHALWDVVGRIGCPTLVVRGEASDVFAEEDAGRVVRALPDGRAVTIAGARHNVQGDQPRELAQELAAFLAGIGH